MMLDDIHYRECMEEVARNEADNEECSREPVELKLD
jgi:hypothetical protein